MTRRSHPARFSCPSLLLSVPVCVICGWVFFASSWPLALGVFVGETPTTDPLAQLAPSRSSRLSAAPARPSQSHRASHFRRSGAFAEFLCFVYSQYAPGFQNPLKLSNRGIRYHVLSSRGRQGGEGGRDLSRPVPSLPRERVRPSGTPYGAPQPRLRISSTDSGT